MNGGRIELRWHPSGAVRSDILQSLDRYISCKAKAHLNIDFKNTSTVNKFDKPNFIVVVSSNF